MGRRRSRSRSRDRRHKRRSRSRDRRSRSRDRRRSRDRGRKERHSSKSKDHKREKKSSASPTNVHSHKDNDFTLKGEPMDKEEEQKSLELEMQKRRERIEAWRAEKKRDKLKELGQLIVPLPSKMWSLEDDEDEDEDAIDKGLLDNKNEIDSLDAYMHMMSDAAGKGGSMKQTIDTKDNNGAPMSDVNHQPRKVTHIIAVAMKRPDPEKKKGFLMESNMDAMEYSSEEEEENLQDTAVMSLDRKKKELAVVDHNKIYYPPFRKAFYVEVQEIAKMTTEDVEDYRLELESIKVRGKNCPKPIKMWAHCGVSKKVLDVLKKQMYEKPTPIQAQGIPAIMFGRDVIGIAKTGSGKTLAFLLPMFRHILDQPPLEKEDGPIAMIMTPTRELAMQITAECKRFNKVLGLNAVCVYGGTGISEQIAELKRGTELVVCTPGRMIDMLAANNGKVTNLRRCTYVVLDEADRMFDMGFEPQVMKIIDNIRPDRQIVMFSATFPRQMEGLARKILNKPIEVQVGGRSVVCKDVEQDVVVLDEEMKLLKLLELLGIYQEQGSVLVFVDKQEHADDLMKDLLKHSYPCMALHGGIDQYDRDSVILDFKSGVVTLLVATSVAARGLDVRHLILVINYDCPNHYEDYVHRCGRTGRAGRKGYAYTFITPEQERYAGDIIRALALSGSPPNTDLNQIYDAYKERSAAEGKKIKSSSGFRGRGFKFDETEAQMADDRRKLQKAALGLNDSDDEDGGVDIDQKIENMFASRKRVTDVAKSLMSSVPTNAAPIQHTAESLQKLEMAKKMAAKINMARNLGAEAQDITQQATLAFVKGEGAAPQVKSKTIAEQMAEKINAKLGYRPPEEEKEADQNIETVKRYEEELEINEFPQSIRWKVTSKEALAQICEYSEAGITVRGSYYAPGKEPKEGDRRLYLAIEATVELAVQKAKSEVTRLIKEELVRLQNSSYLPTNKGRYKVL